VLVLGDIAGGGKDTQHPAGLVVVNDGVVEHVDRAAGGMADGQRVVADLALRETRR